MNYIILALVCISTFAKGQPIEYGGITIITHGFIASGGRIERSDWMFKMGKSIVDKYGGKVHFYQRNTGLFQLEYTSTSTSGKGEMVLIFDWSEESNFDGSGFSEAAGDALFAALMRSKFPLKNLHFIGHSRGAVVNTECVLRLLRSEVQVDQVTNLDPHDWGALKLGTDFDNHPELPTIAFPIVTILGYSVNYFNHPGVVSWENVTFSDTYYQTNGQTVNTTDTCAECMPYIQALEGRTVAGTKSVLWDTYNIEGKIVDMCHTNIHECAYISTINNPSANSDGHYYSRLAGKKGREATGNSKPEKSFDFFKRGFENRIKGIYNGDFERGGALSSKSHPGWGSRHGGRISGEYNYPVLGNNFITLEQGEHLRHNYFFIPKTAKAIKFKYDNNLKSNSILEVVVGSDGTAEVQVCKIKLDSLSYGFVLKSFDISKFAGNVITLEFSVVGSSNSKVKIDDVEFEMLCNSSLFLFDLSGSMNGNGVNSNISKLQQAKNASKQTLSALKNNNSGITNEVAVLGFSGGCAPDPTTVISNFETDLSLVESRIDAMGAGGGTPLAEAIAASECKLANHLAQTGQDKGKLIVLSDGQATCQRIRPPGTYNSGQLGQTVIDVSANQCGSSNYKIKYYTIGFNIAAGSPAERDLQYLSQISGGKYLNVQSQTQLERAFKKFNRTYIPKQSPFSNSLPSTSLSKFDDGVNQINAESFSPALKTYEDFSKLHPDDCHGAYNLALMQEANDFYKNAIFNYQKYLSLCPNSSDKEFVEKQIIFLEEEFREFLLFQKEVVKSDLEYLKLHFEKIQNGQSIALAEEFKGFLKEKGGYYMNLPELMGKSSDRLFKKNCQEVASGLDNCAKTINRNPSTWDRDATPSLSMTYLNLERLLESF